MKRRPFGRRVIVNLAIATLTMSGAVLAQTPSGTGTTTTTTPAPTTTPPPARTGADDLQDAQRQVCRAANVLTRMANTSGIQDLLRRAQGVFVVPTFAQAALGVGARGGEGVLMVKRGGKWSDPAFYNMGGLSIGLQAGAEAGPLALVLNNQRAVDQFRQKNNWTLDANAGLTIVNWSAKAQAAAGRGDVVVWSDTEGLLGDLAVSLNDIRFDEEETAAFYGRRSTIDDVLNGVVKTSSPQVAVLRQAMPGAAGSTARGGSGTAGTQGAGAGQAACPE